MDIVKSGIDDDEHDGTGRNYLRTGTPGKLENFPLEASQR
jgi:hypothetical protein